MLHEWIGTLIRIAYCSVHGRRFLFNIGGTIDRGANVKRRRCENRGAVGVDLRVAAVQKRDPT